MINYIYFYRIMIKASQIVLNFFWLWMIIREKRQGNLHSFALGQIRGNLEGCIVLVGIIPPTNL
jgi:hypothetical protein